MKYMVASDLHGSSLYAELLLKRFDEEKADKLILLGDIYYHGPRNPLPDGFNPQALFELLNARKNDLLVIRGNCDSEVDQMVSEFRFVNSATKMIGGKKYLFTHGHKTDKSNIPEAVDVIVYGHYHINFIEKVGNKWAANPGSVSLPKENTPRGYLLLDGKSIVLKDIGGAVQKREQL